MARPAERGSSPGEGGGSRPSPPRFEATVAENRRFVMALARRIGVPEAHCEDVAQEVFLSLSRVFSGLHTPSALRSWLRTATRYAGINFYHIAQKRREILHDPAHAALDMADPSPSAEEALSQHTGAALYRSLVAELAPERAQVFRKYVEEELPIREIAAVLQISESTAWTRLFLARRDLRAACKRRWKNEERRPGGRSFGLLLGSMRPDRASLRRPPNPVAHGLVARVLAIWRALARSTWTTFAAALVGLAGLVNLVAASLAVSITDSMPAMLAMPALAPPRAAVALGDAAAASFSPPHGLASEATAASRSLSAAATSPTLSVIVAPPTSHPASTKTAPRDLAAAYALLAAAQRALELGKPEAALAIVRAYEREHPADPLPAQHRLLAQAIRERTSPRLPGETSNGVP